MRVRIMARLHRGVARVEKANLTVAAGLAQSASAHARRARRVSPTPDPCHAPLVRRIRRRGPLAARWCALFRLALARRPAAGPAADRAAPRVGGAVRAAD